MSMISTISPRIKALIIDFDGVLWRDQEAIGCLPDIFAAIQANGWRFVFATNNSMHTPEHYQEKLEKFGVSIDNPIIITSSMAVANVLKRELPDGGAVHAVGETGLRTVLQNAGFTLRDEEVLAVVAGLDRNFTFEKLNRAARLIRNGAIFYGTNPDKTFPTPNGLTPGAGSILAALEAASGVAPIIIGKPLPALFQFALEMLHTLPQETLVIGDRLDTDILGGQRAGMRTALVLSGVSKPEELQHWQPKPDLVAVDLAEIVTPP